MRSGWAWMVAAGVGCGGSAVPPSPQAVDITPATASEAAAPPEEPRLRLTAAQSERADELLAGLAEAPREAWLRRVKALRSEVGGAGLARALDAVAREPEKRRWQDTQKLFSMIRELADPDAVDALAAWAYEKERHPHWRGVAGMALAEVGDLRAAPLLAGRMRRAPEDVYEPDKPWQSNARGHLAKTDRQRVVAARLLADLAVMHLGEHARLRRHAEEAVSAWLLELPQPHGTGLRFIAAVDGTRLLPQLRTWAFPTESLPAAGAQPPFPVAYETAQLAMRYVARMRDAESLDALVAQLGRKDPALDITRRGMMGTTMAMRGMALRAVGVGAAQGLSAWGPPAASRTRPALETFIEDDTWHEDAREQACRALAWIAPGAAPSIVDAVVRYGSDGDSDKQFVGACYAEGLAKRGPGGASAATLKALKESLPEPIRLDLARALGRAGLTDAGRDTLRAMSVAPNRHVAARLALLLGGDETDAVTAFRGLPSTVESACDAPLAMAWYRSFSFFSNRALEFGSLERWVVNARAAKEAGYAWPIERLARQLDGLVSDRGPHSLTRPVARKRLIGEARAGNQGAIAVLATMREVGALMALARDEGDHAATAAQALEALRRAG